MQASSRTHVTERRIGLRLSRLMSQWLGGAAVAAVGSWMLWDSGLWPRAAQVDWVWGLLGLAGMLVGVWVLGCAFATTWARARTRHALRLSNEGANHFIGGALPWAEIDDIEVETHVTTHTQRFLFRESESSTTTYSLCIWLYPAAYARVKSGLNLFDRLFFRPALQLEDSRCMLRVPAESLDCEPYLLVHEMNSMRRLRAGRGKA